MNFDEWKMTGYWFDYGFKIYMIRADMIGGIERYINHGIAPGSFLRAVMENDLREAIGRADSGNMGNLPAYTAFLCNEAPAGCHGSREKVAAWMAKGGLSGKDPTP